MEPSHIKRSVSAAIAWTIIADVIHHHGGASDLRVIEMHPGGGQNDLLSIFRVRGEEGSAYDASSMRIGDFNLQSGTMRGSLPGSDEGVEWLRPWLENPDPEMIVDIAIQTLALDVSSRAATNRRIFGCRLMAGLLGTRLLRPDYLDARMAFEDTSGHGGGISERLRPFTGISSGHSTRAEGVQMRDAADCWLLFSGWERKLVGLLRMDGLISSIHTPEKAHDLFPLYRRTRSMHLVLAEAEEILSCSNDRVQEESNEGEVAT